MHGYIQTAIHSAAELTLEKTTYFFYTYSFLNRSFHTPPPQKKKLRLQPFQHVSRNSFFNGRLGWHYRTCIGATQAGTEEHQGLTSFQVVRPLMLGNM